MDRAGSRVGRFPWVTLAVVLAGVSAAVIPGAGELLQYERSAVESGAYWQLLSGQLVHWTPRMALADLLVLLVTGAWLESRSRRLVSWTITATGLIVGVTVHALTPDLLLYRGSSGIASGLFVAAALDICGSQARPWLRPLTLAALVLFGAKIAWEMATGGALFAGQLPPGVFVVPSVHLVGALMGVLCTALAPR